MMDQVSSGVNNPGQEGLSLSFKMCPQFGINYISLDFVFDSEALRNPSFTYFRISKISNDVALLIERMSASCWVVMQWSSWTMASARCSISGLTAVTEWPEGPKSWAPLFLFQKPSLFPPSDKRCFCWPQHFLKHCKDVCGCFALTVYWQQEILSQHIVCTAHYWLGPLWGTDAMVLSASIFTIYKFQKLKICFN